MIHKVERVCSVPEEVLLDENKEAAKHSFYSVGGAAVSPDGRRLAYSVDTQGGERYTLHALELQGRKGLVPAPGIADTSGQIVWAADNKTLFYVKQDDKHRPYQVRHARDLPARGNQPFGKRGATHCTSGMHSVAGVSVRGGDRSKHGGVRV